ncbi:hypothetical protein M407DRAFT_108835 [Tulasnella calospora MUT 4182]|uniref:Uncharacterized protein n=1 Tax=Tulasnella calospora MUT 4182 TaxID=1051891 RepID=A0A0C3QTE8_9AGAM|nr:hypothetical protein M407DRAFT_108835 [Tulasnella calospora MUT 4182]
MTLAGVLILVQKICPQFHRSPSNVLKLGEPSRDLRLETSLIGLRIPYIASLTPTLTTYHIPHTTLHK